MRLPALLLAPLLLAAACSSPATSPAGTGTSQAGTRNFAAEVASTDLYAGAAQRVQVGVFASADHEGVLLLTSGTIAVRLSHFEGGEGTPVEGSARYLPAPGTTGSDQAEPGLTPPDIARGVYELSPVTFDSAGIWQADISFSVEGSSYSLSTQFQVLDEPSLPAPGQPAIPTENLTAKSKPAEAVDSRATGHSPLPDPELHRWTIAEAMDRGMPVLALFSTPVYCQSQFCGPAVDALADMAANGPEHAAYIHIEIWHDYAKGEVNAAAAEWLLREGELTEPWLFLIGSDGNIADRWGPLFDPDEVLSDLEALPV